MGRALALAVAIRELVVTTDPRVVKVLLRDGGDFRCLLVCVVRFVCDWCVGHTLAQFWGDYDCVLLGECGERV